MNSKELAVSGGRILRPSSGSSGRGKAFSASTEKQTSQLHEASDISRKIEAIELADRNGDISVSGRPSKVSKATIQRLSSSTSRNKGIYTPPIPKTTYPGSLLQASPPLSTRSSKKLLLSSALSSSDKTVIRNASTLPSTVSSRSVTITKIEYENYARSLLLNVEYEEKNSSQKSEVITLQLASEKEKGEYESKLALLREEIDASKRKTYELQSFLNKETSLHLQTKEAKKSLEAELGEVKRKLSYQESLVNISKIQMDDVKNKECEHRNLNKILLEELSCDLNNHKLFLQDCISLADDKFVSIMGTENQNVTESHMQSLNDFKSYYQRMQEQKEHLKDLQNTVRQYASASSSLRRELLDTKALLVTSNREVIALQREKCYVEENLKDFVKSSTNYEMGVRLMDQQNKVLLLEREKDIAASTMVLIKGLMNIDRKMDSINSMSAVASREGEVTRLQELLNLAKVKIQNERKRGVFHTSVIAFIAITTLCVTFGFI